MKILGKIFIVILIIFIIGGIFVRIVTEARCKEECKESGGIYSKIKSDGKYFSLRDYCTCFYQNKTETFRLE